LECLCINMLKTVYLSFTLFLQLSCYLL
jgi:hypothetical protein